MTDDLASNGPSVVALGGGHGLALALSAVRQYASSVTAVVSVADDGGSSGRLRRDFGVPPPGDLRRCLVALAGDETVWKDAFEYRFGGGELDGHSLGNLLLVGLAETLGDFAAALDEAGRLLHAVGRVVPATIDPVVLKADVEGEPVEGQVAVMTSEGRIRRVELVPGDAAASPEAVTAIERADQVILGPGSLFTSVLPVLCVQELREAVRDSPGQVVQVANLRPQVPETSGLDATDHVRVMLEHGARVDTFLYDEDGMLHVDEGAITGWGVEPRGVVVARSDGLAHDSGKLAMALRALL